MEHSEIVRDQFTRQAAAYANAQPIRNEEILRRILSAANPQPEDEVLDVASGPGILTCALAKEVRHATGVDLTPAMLDQARNFQTEQRLTNLSWFQADVAKLPCADSTFNLVTCRYAFHHFDDPLAVLKEMKRVCAHRGRIVVVDTAPAREKANAFNRMEKLRDNSHVRALPVEEMVELFAQAGLPNPKVETLRMSGDLNSLLARSYCQPGDDVRCRQIYEESLHEDRIDMQPRREGNNIRYAFPIAITVARNP
jgi:ubiquinone/menaquinone biosynthesis C-methylase UbiE